jgi:hypothetical protein
MNHSTCFQSGAARGAVTLVTALAAGPLLADPRIDSWLTGNSARYARIFTSFANQGAGNAVTTWSNGSQTQSLPAYSGVQEIYSSADWVYLRTTGLGSHVMGPWPANFPNLPANQHGFYRIPRNATAPAAKTLTGLGSIGFFVDGVAMFDSRDGFVWTGSSEGNGNGYWNREAYVNEGATFDPAYAHQENSGTYHYHASPVALRHLLGDHVEYNATTKTYAESTASVSRHSPILGWVRDGYPIYGPYGYAAATNPASGLRRMVTGFQLRNGQRGTDNLTASGRTTLPAWAVRLYGVSASQSGPAVNTTYPLARYMEDNAYLGDVGLKQGTDFDLDEYNGRFCVTPEFPNGTYAYFVSIAADGTPVFPYNIGRAFYGNPTGAAVTALAETVTTNFVGGANSPLVVAPPAVANGEVTLVWSAVEGGTYQVESSANLTAWTTNATGLAAVGNVGTKAIPAVAALDFFRVSQTALADHDSVTNSATNGGGGGPGGGGPALAAVSPSSGSRGITVTLTLTLGGMAPPAAINPSSAALGSLAGTNLSRNGATVTARFAIPANATPGTVTVSVVFPGPPGMGDVTFSLANGFTIL